MSNLHKQKHDSASAKRTNRVKPSSKTNSAHNKQPARAKSTSRKSMPRPQQLAKPRAKAKPVAPRTEAQYLAKPEKFKETWDRVLSVVSKMRSEKISLTQASRDSGILLPIHDAVWLQVPSASMSPLDFHEAVEQEMIATFLKWCPDIKIRVKATNFEDS